MIVQYGTGEALPGSFVRQSQPYKRKNAKSGGAGRESEGVIVPMKPGKLVLREGPLPWSC